MKEKGGGRGYIQEEKSMREKEGDKWKLKQRKACKRREEEGDIQKENA